MRSKTRERSLFFLGLLICFAVAAASGLLEGLIPEGLLGASFSILNGLSPR